MKKILVFCDFYLPSVKSGGGMWTVANLVERFCDRYEFFIITRNYDSPGDTKPYDSVTTNEWNGVFNANVYYADAAELTPKRIAELFNEVAPDCVFMNSVFSTPVVKYLFARRAGLVADTPSVIAPCGELSEGALRSKRFKKKAYLTLARIRGLYAGLIWKATTELEATEIQSVFGKELKPLLAPDLTPKSILPGLDISQKPFKQSGKVDLIFLSRIVPKKNLRYLLELLLSCDEGSIRLRIVGPQEDEAYWRECEALIAKLPANITVDVVGTVEYVRGLELMRESHFFVLPTLNENFGYVFVESMAAGSPIITSDQTVWSSVNNKNAGWAIPLNKSDLWLSTIKNCIEMDNDRFASMAASARSVANDWLSDARHEEATATVLATALNTAR
ncbi:MAG: glycosyltransferase [Blastocatellia bacterium]|nr:glycosyltransferase [Blastocatellia bacterium]